MIRMHVPIACAAAGVSIAVAAVMTIGISAQDAATLQRSDAPSNGFWIDSLDLSKEALRRPRLPRGQTGTPPPLKVSLGGATYAHALPLVSDGAI